MSPKIVNWINVQIVKGWNWALNTGNLTSEPVLLQLCYISHRNREGRKGREREWSERERERGGGGGRQGRVAVREAGRCHHFKLWYGFNVPTPGVHPNPRPLSRWCHPTISSSVIPFSSCPQSFPEYLYYFLFFHPAACENPEHSTSVQSRVLNARTNKQPF